MIFSSFEKILTLLTNHHENTLSLDKQTAEMYVQIWAVMNILDKHMQYLDAEHRIVARLCAVAIITVYFG